MMPIAGRVREVLVKLGDTVAEGQALLMVESPEVSAAVSAYRQAQSNVTMAEANVRKAKTDLERFQDLFEGRAVARKDVLTAENALVQAQTSLEQAQTVVEENRRRVEILGLKPGDFGQRFAVRAPIGGKVLELTVAPGEYRSDTGTPLMTVADLSTVWVASDVPESSIRLITVGERIEIRLNAFPNEVFHARVMRIADTVDPQTRSIRVRAEIENREGRLRPEMFGRMRHEETFAEKVVVPAAAVIEDEGRALVYVERARGEFEEVAIGTGRPNDGIVPVLQGLKAGDRVVVDGVMLLRGN
jgi:cobalt-zinc-cadmium efflux system membrane fusion protein